MITVGTTGSHCFQKTHGGKLENLQRHKVVFLIFPGGSEITKQQIEWFPFELLIQNDITKDDAFS
jgi:hypothetical protein